MYSAIAIIKNKDYTVHSLMKLKCHSIIYLLLNIESTYIAIKALFKNVIPRSQFLSIEIQIAEDSN